MGNLHILFLTKTIRSQSKYQKHQKHLIQVLTVFNSSEKKFISLHFGMECIWKVFWHLPLRKEFSRQTAWIWVCFTKTLSKHQLLFWISFLKIHLIITLTLYWETLIFMIFCANQSVSKETLHLYKIIVSKPVHVNGLSLFQIGISKNFSSIN